MRVGVVTTSYPRWTGDPAGAFVAGFARWMAGQGHEVEVVAAGPGHTADGKVAVRRVQAGAGLFYGEGAPERLESSLFAWRHAPLFTAAQLASTAWAARRWNAVVSHWLLPSGLAASLALAITRRRIPHLAIAHSADVHLCAQKGVADRVVALLGVGGGVELVFVGEHLKQRMLAALQVHRREVAQALVCPMGVDVAWFAAARAQERHAARRALALPAQGRVIGFLGRLVPVKGVDVLLEAAAKLAVPTTLIVGGDGPERARLAEKARGLDVVFPGVLAGPRLAAFWAAIDVFALPSVDLATGRTEGTPTVVLEALAAGVPLVASDVGGVRAAVRDAALLVPPGNATLLAAALSGALAQSSSPTGDAVSRAERGRVLAGAYDWDRIGARLWEVLCQSR